MAKACWASKAWRPRIYFAGFAQAAQRRRRLRHRRPQPPPAPRPGQRAAIVRLCHAGQGADRRLLHAVGFDPMLGFYHRPRYGRPSLALDLAEEFRPLVADSVVLTLVNNGEVTPPASFVAVVAVALTDAGRRARDRRLRAADGHAGDSPDVRLPHQLPPRCWRSRPGCWAASLLGEIARVSELLHPVGGHAMRNVYLVCYDVADDKRLRKTYQEDVRLRRPAAILRVPLRVVADGKAADEGIALGDSELGQGSRHVDRSWPGGCPRRRVHRVLGRAAVEPWPPWSSERSACRCERSGDAKTPGTSRESQPLCRFVITRRRYSVWLPHALHSYRSNRAS